MFVPLAAAVAASLPLSLAMAAGLPIGDDGQNGAPSATQAALDRAGELLSQGKPVAARALLVKTLDAQEDGTIHVDGWRTKAMELLARAGKQIRETEPNALSVQ
jgi:hypothetical protein